MLLLFYFGGVISSMNLDGVLTCNNIALIYLRSRSHINASMVLTRVDHVFIHNYIRSYIYIYIYCYYNNLMTLYDQIGYTECI